MRDETKETTKPEHWLYIEPTSIHDEELRMEIVRLQRTIRLLMAADFVSEKKVEQAYEMAGW